MYSKANYRADKKTFEPKNTSSEEELNNSSIVIEDEANPCAPKKEKKPFLWVVPGPDPRFQQQDQTVRCFVMYTDFFQCEYLLGEGAEACTWFQNVYKSICPNSWISRWDALRAENRMPWYKQGPFPKAPYGK